MLQNRQLLLAANRYKPFFSKILTMKKILFSLCIIYLTTLFSCNRTDFNNPEEVIKSYRNLSIKNKNEVIYKEFLSSKSKEFVTSDEFIKSKIISDSILNSTIILESKISSYPIDINNPTYRRFKVNDKVIFNKDTIYNRYYYSLINENGKWKIIWTGTLLSFAEKKYQDGNYSEARKMVEKIIEINPFSGEAYKSLAWCYIRDYSISANERENEIVKNAKYAITLEEDNPTHYNTLAAYYSNIDNTDLAIQYCERGLSYCQNIMEKATFYSNLSGAYLYIKEYDKAENYIKKSIEINSEKAFVWYKYGELMYKQNQLDKAIEYFEIALKKAKMESAIQGDLYYLYSFCSLKKGNCLVAKEYINKALDIAPNDFKYQSLFDKIKYCESNN